MSSELQRISRSQIVDFLALCSDSQRLVDYQNLLSYVETPRELFHTWQAAYLYKERWFKSAYSEAELSELDSFDKAIAHAWRNIPQSIVDIEDVFQYECWTTLMSAARSALLVFGVN